MPHVFGVLSMEWCSAKSPKLSIDGVPSGVRSKRSSRMMTIVMPLGPMFFWAPAYIRPYLETSISRERISDEASQTTGTPSAVSPYGNCTPSIVSFEV